MWNKLVPNLSQVKGSCRCPSGKFLNWSFLQFLFPLLKNSLFSFAVEFNKIKVTARITIFDMAWIFLYSISFYFTFYTKFWNTNLKKNIYSSYPIFCLLTVLWTILRSILWAKFSSFLVNFWNFSSFLYFCRANSLHSRGLLQKP